MSHTPASRQVCLFRRNIKGKNSSNIENKNKNDNSAIRCTLRINTT
jgi:hypothetical protein